MKVYVINLDRRTDRMEHMLAECSSRGIQFERIAAVDGEDPEVAEAASHCPAGRTGLPIHQMQYACFESHRRCWQALLAAGTEYALILEDDVSLSRSIGSFLRTDWIPSGADVIKLETYEVRVHIERGDCHLVNDRAVARLRSSHLGCGGYIVSRGAAADLVKKSSVVSEPVDRFMFDARYGIFEQLCVYQVIPALVLQGSGKHGGGAAGSWAETSIPERFSGTAKSMSRRKGLIRRGFERAIQELRASRAKTRYVFVPFH